MEYIEIDKPNESIEGTLRIRENGFHLRPVSPEESGEGLPYAPENWPLPGDNWGWRVGRRVAHTGHFLDRYLYLPMRLFHQEKQTCKKRWFASKLSVERYIQTAFPDADLAAFFASFSWKIPAKTKAMTNGNVAGLKLLGPSEETTEHSASDSKSDGMACKAGNTNCNSLVVQEGSPPLAVMSCDICCSEPHFCRECCCILCCKTINLNLRGYSYIKCEAMVGQGYICGHIAHLNCALRSYMAGTVGGSIGLDAEYYCRRCDARTDLAPHVTRFLGICESIDSQDDVEEILNVGVCILRGSQRTIAKMLLSRIELVITKLKCGTSLEDIWKIDENKSAPCTGISGNGDTTLEIENHQDPLDLLQSGPIPFDYQNELLKLEDEIYDVLQALRKSQETEYKIAEERLFAQKKYLDDLYQQLENERAQLSCRTSSTDANGLLAAVLDRSDQIKREVMKLKEMEEVAKGFGRTPKGILMEHFDL